MHSLAECSHPLGFIFERPAPLLTLSGLNHLPITANIPQAPTVFNAFDFYGFVVAK